MLRTIVLSIVSTLVAAPIGAQVLERPARSSGGVFGGRQPADPNRTTQQLRVTMGLLGGYDDAITPDGEPDRPFRPQPGGYAGSVSGALEYWRGRSARSIEANGMAYFNQTSHSNQSIQDLIGADASLQGTTQLGERTTLSGSVGLEYQPTLLQGALTGAGAEFGPGATAIPSTNTFDGVAEQRWWHTSMSGSATRNWTARQRSAFGYDYLIRQPRDDAGFEGRTGNLSMTHNWDPWRGGGVRVSYRMSDAHTIDADGIDDPLRTHGFDVGMNVQKRFSATRALTVSGGAGATRGETTAGAAAGAREPFVVPSYFGSIRGDVVRTWAVWADVRRDLSLLQGLSPQPFATDTALLNAGGSVGRRLDLAFSAGLTRGVAQQNDTGEFESLSGTAQVTFDASRWWSLVASYGYYDHRVRDVASIPDGFPARYRRNTARIGVTLQIPIYGTFPTN